MEINVRPFAWHDLLTLYRNRRRVLCTNSALMLTSGSPLNPLAMLTHLDPTRGIFTAVSSGNNGEQALFGQITYVPGRRSAQLSFLLPEDELTPALLSILLEALAEVAGSWGALNLLAEIEERSVALESVRRNGFNVYAWQTIWHMQPKADSPHAASWGSAYPIDENPVRSLYQLLVPPLVQSAEPFEQHNAQRVVFRQEGEILAYADVLSGTQGIYLQPVVHPAVANPDAVLEGLLARLPASPQRPVYVAARSYQAWLEPSLTRLNGLCAPRSALIVKHLAVAQRAALLARQTARELLNHEASVPLAQHSTIHDN